ncbi:hypothetical protein COCON_G00037690 [Conger conger]|uniref:RabBD domain-containing protein n=1 Tax=Conger conger TaxID=82655 RepID=A0A9Q1E0K2_CONCO|nr:hypothetical protein COCON_G00037690 [Conger conger]
MSASVGPQGGPRPPTAPTSMPDLPDLSHLTEEERKIIMAVMVRQKEEEDKEDAMLKGLSVMDNWRNQWQWQQSLLFLSELRATPTPGSQITLGGHRFRREGSSHVSAQLCSTERVPLPHASQRRRCLRLATCGAKGLCLLWVAGRTDSCARRREPRLYAALRC